MIRLDNGYEIPQLGVGTWTLKGDTAINNVRMALEAGFRLIDTAQMYENESEVGQGIIGSCVPREEIFLTTKVNTGNMRAGEDAVRMSIVESLKRLKVDYIDLLLIHWPVKGCIRYTWRVMEEFVRSGQVRSIGLSNFNPDHLDDLLSYAEIRPVVNQIELHPFMSQEENIAYNSKYGIQVIGWAPFGQGDLNIPGHPLLKEIAAKYDKTSSQVVLRWIIQRGLITIPRAKPNHFAENLDVMNFTLADEDMRLISGMNENRRSSEMNNPESFPW